MAGRGRQSGRFTGAVLSDDVRVRKLVTALTGVAGDDFRACVARGRRIIAMLFGGRAEVWWKQGVNHRLFIELARQPDVALSKAELGTAATAYALSATMTFPESAQPSFVAAVKHLALEEQRWLLGQAFAHDWSLERLTQ